MTNTQTDTRSGGRAYAIMYLEASKEQIEAELPKAREAAQTPSPLEISVRRTKDLMADPTADRKLVKYIGQNFVKPIYPEKYLGPVRFKSPQVNMTDMPYILEAKYANGTNEQAAAEMADVTNYLYYAFGQDRPFCAKVIAKAPDGQYDSWRND